MKFSKREYLLVGAVAILICVISLSAFSRFFNVKESETDDWFLAEEIPRLEEVEEIIIEEIIIDVKGAVKHPGVYQMQANDRVIDAIERAGGLLEEADVNQLNFASLLHDEMVVFVPTYGEESTLEVAASHFQSKSGEHQGKIRINYATSQELEQLSGIGPAKAAAILAYREENGPFKTEEDLLNVSGIGQKTFEQIKDAITVK